MFLAVRIIEGFFEGVTFPGIHAVWARWSPPLERSRMASIAFAGNYAGTVVAMPCSGFLATKYGWQSVFYVFGTIGVAWYIIWLIFVKAGPELDRFCSKEECDYIQKTIGYVGTKHIKHPGSPSSRRWPSMQSWPRTSRRTGASTRCSPSCPASSRVSLYPVIAC